MSKDKSTTPPPPPPPPARDGTRPLPGRKERRGTGRTTPPELPEELRRKEVTPSRRKRRRARTTGRERQLEDALRRAFGDGDDRAARSATAPAPDAAEEETAPRRRAPEVETASAEDTPDPADLTERDPRDERLELIDSLEQRLTIELAATPEEHNRLRAILMHELGQLAELVHGEREVSLERYQEAVAWDGMFLPGLRALERHRAVEESWTELVAILRAETDLAVDGSSRAALMTRAGLVLAFRLSDTDGALKILRSAFALDPGAGSAGQVLRYLYASLERWEDLLELLRSLAGVAEGALERAWILLEMAELCDLQLGRPEDALELYGRVRELNPGCRAAVLALLRLQQQTGRWQEHCDLLEQEGSGDRPADRRFADLYRAARVAQLRLQDEERAARLLEQAAALRPQEPLPLQELAVIYQRLGRHRELGATLARQLELMQHPHDRAAICHRIGRVLQDRLSRPDEAMDAFRDALDALPGHEASMRALAALMEQRGEWQELIRLELLRAERQKDEAVRAAAYMQAARMCEKRLEDRRQTIDLMERAWRLAWKPQAFRGLERLYRQAGRWDALVDLYLEQAERTEDTALGLSLRRAAAHVCEEMLEDQARARDLLEAVLQAGDGGAAPLDRLALMDLARLHERSGKAARLFDLLGQWADLTEDAQLRTDLRRRRAQLLEEELDQPQRALAAHTALLEQDPGDAPTRHRLKVLHEQAGRWDMLVEMLRAELLLLGDPAEKAQVLVQIGALCRDKIGDADLAREAWEQALEHDSACTPAVMALEELLRDQGRWDQLADLMERGANEAVDPGLAAARLCATAEVCEEHLADRPRARKLYARAVKVSPPFPPAMAGLERSMRGEQDTAGLDQFYRRAAEAAEHPGTRLRALHRLSALRAGEGEDLSGGREALELGLAGAAEDLDALMALSRLHRRAGAAGALSDVLGKVARCADDPALELAALRERAIAEEVHGGSPETLVEINRRILLAAPGDQIALAVLDRRAFEERDEPALIALAQRRLEAGGDEFWIASLCVRGALLLFAIGATERAAEILREGLSTSPGYLPALLLLRALAAQLQWTEEEIDLLLREGELGNERALAHEALLRAGDMLVEQFEDLARARGAWEQVFTEDPGSTEAYARLREMMRGSEEWRPLAGLMRRRIQAVEPAERPPLLLELCGLWRDHLLDPTAAADALVQLLELEPEHREALTEAADLARALRRWSDADGYLANLAEACRDDPAARRRAMLDRAALLDERLRQVDLALDVLQELLAERPGDRDALTACAAIFQRRRQWDRLAQVLEELVRSAAGGERVRHLVALADIFHGPQKDSARSSGALRRAAATCLESGEGCEDIVQHFERREDFAGLASFLAETLEGVAVGTAGARAMRQAMARTLAERLGQVDRAELELSQALDTAPDDMALRLDLAALLTGSGKLGEATTHFMEALKRDAFEVEIYRGMFSLWQARGDNSRAAGAAQTVCALAGGDEAEQAAAKAALRDLEERLAANQGPGEEPGDLLHLLAHPDEPDLLREMFAILGDAVPAIYPDQVERMEKAASREGALTRLPRGDGLVVMCKSLARAMGIQLKEVCGGALPGGQLAMALAGKPWRLVLDSRRCPSLPPARVRFAVGRALARGHTRTLYLDLLTPGEVGLLLSAVAEYFQRGHAGTLPDGPAVQELSRVVGRALPRKARRQLEGPARAYAASRPADPAAWARGARWTADRVGLVVSGEVGAAYLTLDEERQGRESLAQLLRFAVSPHLYEARRRLALDE